jgi:curli biogenesis system outer membrane secretion channel CsgG
MALARGLAFPKTIGRITFCFGEIMKLKIILTGVATTLIAGCAASVDKASVQATSTAPTSVQVESVRIPYDASQPMYVVTVEPLQVGADGSAGGPPPSSGQSDGNYYGWGPFGWIGPRGGSPAPTAYEAPLQGMSDKVGKGIAAQLLSSLGNSGNIVVIDYDHYLKHSDNPAKLLRPGEVGPFVIKGTVTEFSEVAEANNERKGGSLGWAGTVLGVAGAISGTPAAGIAGAAVSAANPTWENTKARRTGAVGLDLQVVEPDSGRMVGTIVSHGSFSAESASSGVSVFGIGGGESAFAASALGQATRAAMNDTVKQLSDQLRVKGPAYARVPATVAKKSKKKR